MINNHHRFLNWIERRAKTHPHKPESFFTTLGHLNQVMSALETKEDVLPRYQNREINAARTLMQMSNTEFLAEITKMKFTQVALSSDGIQVLRWFKDRDLNDQGNLVSNLGFLTEIVHDSQKNEVSNWDRQTLRVAQKAQQLSDDELISLLLKCQFGTQRRAAAWLTSYTEFFKFQKPSYDDGTNY